MLTAVFAESRDFKAVAWQKRANELSTGMTTGRGGPARTSQEKEALSRESRLTAGRALRVATKLSPNPIWQSHVANVP